MEILIRKTAIFVQILCRKTGNGMLFYQDMKQFISSFLKIIVMSFALSAFLTSCAPADEYIIISGYAQGGTYTVKFNMNGKDGRIGKSPEEIRDHVDSLLLQIDRSLSGYNRNSILSRLNAGEKVVPDGIFLDMYRRSYEIYRDTDGVVDVASAPLFDIWGFGFSKGDFPSPAQVDSVRSVSGMGRLVPDLADVLDQDGCISSRSMTLNGGAAPELNFNAVAQGYSCDVIAGYLYSLGVKDMLVDIGEFFCDGLNPSGKPWTIGIDRPFDGNNTAGADLQGIFRAPSGPHGIVTSGNYRKFYVRDGKKYAHTIDPRTGYPVEHSLLSATIVAADATTADAYATWCMVVGLDKSKEFLDSTEGFEGCLIYDEDGKMKTWCSKGFAIEIL